MSWTHFWDMHSGGGTKVKPWNHIYIEAPEEEARAVFYNRFHRNPSRVTCTCCGEDYSVSSEETLERLTGFHRNCAALETPQNEEGRYIPPDDPWFRDHYYLEPGEEVEAERRGYKSKRGLFSSRNHKTLAEYVKEPDVLVIRASEIKLDERCASIPEEGYVWQGDD